MDQAEGEKRVLNEKVSRLEGLLSKQAGELELLIKANGGDVEALLHAQLAEEKDKNAKLESEVERLRGTVGQGTKSSAQLEGELTVARSRASEAEEEASRLRDMMT